MMKQSPEMRAVSRLMAPGVVTRDGFLGHDRRRLEEILDADRSTVVRLGTTHGEIAGALRAAFDAVRSQLGRPTDLGEGLQGVYREAMGRIPCVWPGCGVFQKGEVELTDARTGETLILTDLGIHLIARHGFYQGRGSRCRIEPEVACRLFGLGDRSA